MIRAGVKYTFSRIFQYKYTIFNQIQIHTYFYMIQIHCQRGIKYKYVFDPRPVHDIISVKSPVQIPESCKQ